MRASTLMRRYGCNAGRGVKVVRTAFSFTYNRVGTAGFEPATSCTPSNPNGRIRNAKHPIKQEYNASRRRLQSYHITCDYLRHSEVNRVVSW